jgi:hypothetical protein
MTLPPQGEPVENLIRGIQDLALWFERSRALRVPTQVTAVSASPTEVAHRLADVIQYLQDLRDIRPPVERLRAIEDVADFFGDQDERAEHLEAQVRDILRGLAAIKNDVGRLPATFHAQWAVVKALKRHAGGAWTKSNGWCYYIEAYPASESGYDDTKTLYLRLPRWETSDGSLGVRELQTGQYVRYTPSQRCFKVGDGTTPVCDGYVTADSVPLGGGLPILKGGTPTSRNRMSWFSPTEPDTEYEYDTGWAIDTTLKGRVGVMRDPDDPDFDTIVGPGPVGIGGAKTHTHPGSTVALNLTVGDYGEQTPATPVEVVTGGTASPTVASDSHLMPYFVMNRIVWNGLDDADNLF